MTEPGHNNPPGMIETAGETAADLNVWLGENVAIDDKSSSDAKVWIDRSHICLQELDDERDGLVRPLNEQVKAINATYRQPRDLLRRLLDELEERVANYLRAKEAKQQELARIARQAAEDAERAAREAERLEQERFDDARRGELGVDLAGASAEADQAFADYEKAHRQAAIAERDAKVRIGGGFARAVGLKEKETITVDDPHEAIRRVGLTDDIKTAIIRAARAYRRLHGVLPPGVQSTVEKTI